MTEGLKETGGRENEAGLGSLPRVLDGQTASVAG